ANVFAAEGVFIGAAAEAALVAGRVGDGWRLSHAPPMPAMVPEIATPASSLAPSARNAPVATGVRGASAGGATLPAPGATLPDALAAPVATAVEAAAMPTR